MKVLLAEDDPILVESYQEIAEPLDIKIIPFQSGSEAFKYIENHYSEIGVYVLDINLNDEIDGKKLIHLVKDLSEDNIVIVQTGVNQPSEIIEIMKNHVFEYLVKPVSPHSIESTLKKALQYKLDIESKREFNHKAVAKLQDYIKWNSFKESALAQGLDSQERKLIYNLKTSLSQGSGVGASISLIDMIEATAAQADNRYVVDAEMMALLFENNKASKIVINGMEKVLNLLDSSFSFEKIKISDIYEKLKRLSSDLEAFARSKNVSVVFSDIKDAEIFVDPEKVFMALEELLINAIKYSAPVSVIYVMSTKIDGYARISFKNKISDDEANLIKQSKSFIGQPFFRIHPPVEDVCSVEKFSIGSGIMAVEYIVKKNSGIFSINTVLDYTGKKPAHCIVSEAMFELKE